MLKKTLLIVILANIILISLCTYALAAAPSISISLPTNKRFLIEGDDCNTVVNITGSVSGNVRVYYPETDISADAYLDLVSGTQYQGSFEITSSERYIALSTSSGYIGFKRFEVAANNSDGLGQAYRYYAVAVMPSLSDYTAVSNVNRGDFIYPYTNIYNCHAYGIDVKDYWYNIGANNPLLSEDFMLKRGIFANRSGIKYTATCSENNYPDAVYFSGDHTARVISWSSNGKPYIMQSKWGDWECIKTYGSNPFTSSSYGSPSRWYKR